MFFAHRPAAGGLVLLLLAASTDASQNATSPCWLRVVVVNAARMSADQLDIFRDNVERVWAPYNIRFEWREGVPEGMRSLEGVVVLVLVRALPRAPSHHEVSTTLGLATFDEPVAPAHVLHVLASYDALAKAQIDGAPFCEWPASRQQQLVAQVAGRVAAHEVGHYLLATRHHTDTGLMRAGFSWPSLLGWDLSAFQLSARDAVMVRTRWLSVTSCLPGDPVALQQATNRSGPPDREEP